MRHELVDAIYRNTEVLFDNARIMLQTCDMDLILCDMPIWKHAYHMLHSCDQWFINPKHYVEPDFHVPYLNSLDIPSARSVKGGAAGICGDPAGEDPALRGVPDRRNAL